MFPLPRALTLGVIMKLLQNTGAEATSLDLPMRFIYAQSSYQALYPVLTIKIEPYFLFCCMYLL